MYRIQVWFFIIFFLPMIEILCLKKDFDREEGFNQKPLLVVMNLIRAIAKSLSHVSTSLFTTED